MMTRLLIPPNPPPPSAPPFRPGAAITNGPRVTTAGETFRQRVDEPAPTSKSGNFSSDINTVLVQGRGGGCAGRGGGGGGGGAVGVADRLQIDAGPTRGGMQTKPPSEQINGVLALQL